MQESDVEEIFLQPYFFTRNSIVNHLNGHLPSGSVVQTLDCTYPSPKPTSTLTSHLGQNVGLGEG